MNIAMLYICTGKYEVFWDAFYKTCEENFYPGIQKDYFVFSDSKRIQQLQADHVHVYMQPKAGWPYDTLLRYNCFCTVQDRLKAYDCCYYANANTEFIRPITEAVIPFPDADHALVLGIHSHMYEDCTGALFQPERNAQSTAYIPQGTACRAHCGGFWGGTSAAVIKMCSEQRDRIATDLKHGIIAIWHDQSHLIKYATEVPHYNIEKDIVSSEEYMHHETCAIVFVNKDKFGGNDTLRELRFSERVKNAPKKVYGKVLKIASAVHLDTAIRRVVKKIVK